MIDPKLKKKAGLAPKNVTPRSNQGGHFLDANPARVRQKGLVKRLPIAIAKSAVRTIYPTEVEELCQVLEMMIKRILAEEIQVHHAEELAIAA